MVQKYCTGTKIQKYCIGTEIQKYCIGTAILHWYRNIALVQKYCIGTGIQKYCIGTEILHCYRNIALVQRYCIGTAILHWYRNIALVQKYRNIALVQKYCIGTEILHCYRNHCVFTVSRNISWRVTLVSPASMMCYWQMPKRVTSMVDGTDLHVQGFQQLLYESYIATETESTACLRYVGPTAHVLLAKTMA